MNKRLPKPLKLFYERIGEDDTPTRQETSSELVVNSKSKENLLKASVMLSTILSGLFVRQTILDTKEFEIEFLGDNVFSDKIENAVELIPAIPSAAGALLTGLVAIELYGNLKEHQKNHK